MTVKNKNSQETPSTPEEQTKFESAIIAGPDPSLKGVKKTKKPIQNYLAIALDESDRSVCEYTVRAKSRVEAAQIALKERLEDMGVDMDLYGILQGDAGGYYAVNESVGVAIVAVYEEFFLNYLLEQMHRGDKK